MEEPHDEPAVFKFTVSFTDFVFRRHIPRRAFCLTRSKLLLFL